MCCVVAATSPAAHIGTDHACLLYAAPWTRQPLDYRGAAQPTRSPPGSSSMRRCATGWAVIGIDIGEPRAWLTTSASRPMVGALIVNSRLSVSPAAFETLSRMNAQIDIVKSCPFDPRAHPPPPWHSVNDQTLPIGGSLSSHMAPNAFRAPSWVELSGADHISMVWPTPEAVVEEVEEFLTGVAALALTN